MKKKQTQGELIFGIHPIIELLKAKKRKLLRLYTTKPTPKGFATIEKLLPEHVPIQYVTRAVLNRMLEEQEHQSVIAWVQPFVYRNKMFDPQKQPSLLMLESVQDTRNLGAILRSAFCTGVDGVILPQKKSAPITSTVLKASAGLAEHLQIYQVPSAKAGLQELKDAGYHIYLATLGGSDARSCEYKRPLCLVVGNESVGIDKQLFKYGKQITLPERVPGSSYNASVATGILLFLINQKL
jgi:23S rRNA (guanosine2251-2'-O)-methyltransferase